MNISVVMSVYNESIKDLDLSINSILNQTYKNFEFIIIDDNPESLEIKHFLLNKSSIDSRIKLLFNKKNLGLTSSVNKGINFAHGKYIARMDADDISDKKRLYNQIKFIKRNNIDLCCTNFIGFYSNLNNCSSPYYGPHDIINQHIIRKKFSNSNIAMGPTLFFNKHAFEVVGGYRKLFTDDYDLTARFLINNFSVGYLSKALLYKRNRKDNLSNNHSLNEFISTYLISKELKKDNYKSEVPMIKFKKSINNVTKRDVKIFKEFKCYLNSYKETNNIMYLIKSILISFLSILVLKRNLWMTFVNLRNKYSV